MWCQGATRPDSERSSTSRLTYTIFGGPSPQKDEPEGKLEEGQRQWFRRELVRVSLTILVKPNSLLFLIKNHNFLLYGFVLVSRNVSTHPNPAHPHVQIQPKLYLSYGFSLKHRREKSLPTLIPITIHQYLSHVQCLLHNQELTEKGELRYQMGLA